MPGNLLSSAPIVVVLPFANLNAEPGSDFFSDGLTDELTHVLGRVVGLRLIARTSVYQFKGRMLDVRELSRELGVTHVVEGAVRRVGSRLRVTAGLISTTDGCQVWTGHWDRDSTDVLRIQHQVSTRIAKALRLSLKAPAATRMAGQQRQRPQLVPSWSLLLASANRERLPASARPIPSAPYRRIRLARWRIPVSPISME